MPQEVPGFRVSTGSAKGVLAAHSASVGKGWIALDLESGWRVPGAKSSETSKIWGPQGLEGDSDVQPEAARRGDLGTNPGAPSFCLGFLDKLLEEQSILIVTEGAAFLVL